MKTGILIVALASILAPASPVSAADEADLLRGLLDENKNLTVQLENQEGRGEIAKAELTIQGAQSALTPPMNNYAAAEQAWSRKQEISSNKKSSPAAPGDQNQRIWLMLNRAIPKDAD